VVPHYRLQALHELGEAAARLAAFAFAAIAAAAAAAQHTLVLADESSAVLVAVRLRHFLEGAGCAPLVCEVHAGVDKDLQAANVAALARPERRSPGETVAVVVFVW
jgi:hypothetical protein